MGGDGGSGWDDIAAMSARRPTPSDSSRVVFRRLVGDGDGDGDVALAVELAERLDTVLGIAERLAASHDRADLFRTIVDETMRALRADNVTLRVLDDDRMVLAAWAGLDDEMAARLPTLGVTDGWVADVVRSGRVTDWTDASTDERHGMDRYDADIRWAGALAAPLTHDGRIVGVLNACTLEPREWSEGDIAFMTALATHAAIALANADLFAETSTRAAQLAMLQAASARLARAGSVEAIGRTVVEEARRIIDYHNARVYLVEPPDLVVPIAFEGRVGAYEHVDMDLLRCRLGEGFTGWVAEHGEPILASGCRFQLDSQSPGSALRYCFRLGHSRASQLSGECGFSNLFSDATRRKTLCE